MKTLRQLNKDEITLLKLLSDSYMFANLSDVTDNHGAKSNLNYVSVDHENGLDHKLCSTVCNPIADAIVNIIGQDLFNEWIGCSNLIVDDLINIIDHKLNKKKMEEKRMEILCSGNYENVLDLIEKAHGYSIWIQTSDEDGFYDHVNREQFENKMVELIEDNNCHIDSFYFQEEDRELTYERRV
tara:strand:+ start:134 stop:685 length:552 start_codon:yes stop_codon:yes gene_type:complete